MHVAKVDVPAFVAGFEIAAAGQVGHATLKRRYTGQAMIL
jgi:hypothetical protein